MTIGKFSDIGTFGDIGNENISAKNRKLCKFFDDIETPSVNEQYFIYNNTRWAFRATLLTYVSI